MGVIKKHPPVQLFAAITFNPGKTDENLVLQKLETHFGSIDFKSALFDFDQFTDYYEKEMGQGLKKRFVAFYDLIEPEALPEIKVRTNAFEKEISKDKGRVVNIDPGYLTLSKVVLATTKDYSHRLYLGQGIFGDLHLVFIHKTFTVQPWTYPDYQQSLAIDFFMGLRNTYRKKLGERLEFNA